MNFFTSDLHLNHNSIIKYRSEKFNSQEEHDEYIIEKIHNLGKRDILYILGDSIFSGDKFNWYVDRFRGKKCRIKLVMGNHCSLDLLKHQDIFEIQLPLFSYKNMWISHCPIHPYEMRDRKGNIHGHLHKEVVKRLDTPNSSINPEQVDKRYFNVNLDVNNYEFVTLEQIKDYFGG